MKIAFAGGIPPCDFQNIYDEKTNDAELVLFGLDVKKCVSYERELNGETQFFKEVALLSKKTGGVVVCGCVTDARGHLRKSAVVAEKGRLLGVSDAVYTRDSDVSGGALMRVYETEKGKIGVLVGEDLYAPDLMHSLTLCGSEYIVCPFYRVESLHTSLLRSHAFCYGTPLVFCAQNYALIADPSGEIAFGTPQAPTYFNYSYKGEYHLVQTRKRGVRK